MGAKLEWEGWLLEEGRNQTGWRAPSTPSPAQPACPLWPLLRTPALTHTPRVLQFCLKGPSQVPPALSGFFLKERERLVELGKGNEHELIVFPVRVCYMRARDRE